MATAFEEFQAQRLNANRAIPGESLTNDPENPAPFEKAPTFTSVHEASDLMLMLIEPTTYMLMALAERAELPMVIYEGELNDENDEEELLGTQVAEDRIRDIIKRGRTGDIPEGTLTAEMQASLESLPPVELPSQQEEAPEQEEPQSLMARPETAGV